jgi:hypothetical protein
MTAVELSWADRATHLSRRPGRVPPQMSDLIAREARRTQKLNDWLLAILRFAVTLEQIDRATVLAIAKDMDRAGSSVGSIAFAFFARTSTELCNAIADRNDPRRVATLSRHLRRIDDYRLRRALEAATKFEQAATTSSKAKKRDRGDLWRGC